MLAFSRRAALWLPLLAVSAAWAAEDPDNTVILTTKHGKVVIRLRPDWAPKHVAQIKTLVKQKFYDGIVFHRVIPGFMAQTGDPTGTGSGGSTLPNLPAEFNPTHFTRGILGMARSEDPDSANSQFFITHRRRRIPRRQIYRFRRGRLGNGRRRQDQGRNPGQQWRGHEPRQDRDHAHGAPKRSDEERRYGERRRHADPRDDQRPGGDRDEPGARAGPCRAHQAPRLRGFL